MNEGSSDYALRVAYDRNETRPRDSEAALAWKLLEEETGMKAWFQTRTRGVLDRLRDNGPIEVQNARPRLFIRSGNTITLQFNLRSDLPLLGRTLT